MMDMKYSKVQVRRALYGWVAYLPLLIGLFVMLAIDTHFNVCSRHTDYQYGQLSVERLALIQQLDTLNSEEARLNGMQALDALAAAIGLQPPIPGQIQTIIPRNDLPLPILTDTHTSESVNTSIITPPPPTLPISVTAPTVTAKSFSAPAAATAPRKQKVTVVSAQAASKPSAVTAHTTKAPSNTDPSNLDQSTDAMMAAL